MENVCARTHTQTYFFFLIVMNTAKRQPTKVKPIDRRYFPQYMNKSACGYAGFGIKISCWDDVWAAVQEGAL